MVEDGFSEAARTGREQQNNQIWINKLPTEILSRIFTIGEEMDQIYGSGSGDEYRSGSSRSRSLEFQELVIQVCRRWRTIGVNTPMLWTYISLDLSEVNSRDRAALFLKRSGPTVPLEVEIDITDPSFDSDTEDFDSELQARRTSEDLEFVVSHGGTPSRWARLAVWFDVSSAMFAVIDFIADFPLDNLRKLSLVNTYFDPILTEDLATEALRKRDLSQSIMFKTAPPVLQELELVGMPSSFLFARQGTPLVANLTHLELGSILSLPPLKGLYDLLSNSVQLESLCLDMGMIETTEFQLESAESIRVSLPNLRRFSLQEPISVAWGLSIVKMIDAPELEAFSLNLDQSQQYADAIAWYVARGRTDGRLVNGEPSESQDKIGPIYPALKQLALGPFVGTSSSLKGLLASSNQVIRLDWEPVDDTLISITSMFIDPASSQILCPRLEHLRVFGVDEDDLVEIVRWRKSQGKPLSVVEVNSRDWDDISDNTRLLLGQELTRFGEYVDSDESDSDSEEDDSEEDDSGWSDVDTEDSMGDSSSDDSDEAPLGFPHEIVSTDDDSDSDTDSN